MSTKKRRRAAAAVFPNSPKRTDGTVKGGIILYKTTQGDVCYTSRRDDRRPSEPLFQRIASSVRGRNGGQPKNREEKSRPVTTEVSMAKSAAGTVKRVFLIPTLPKYSASV